VPVLVPAIPLHPGVAETRKAEAQDSLALRSSALDRQRGSRIGKAISGDYVLTNDRVGPTRLSD